VCNNYGLANATDLLAPGVADDDGVLDPRGTRTPRMYYYQGSALSIEWTMQHGCGANPRLNCDVVLQYACEDTLSDDCGQPGAGLTCGPRDGVPITNNLDDGANGRANRGTATYNSIFPFEGVQQIDRFSRDTQATETIPDSIDYNAQSDPRFGRHEGLSYYSRCYWRMRNMGLWIADRNLQGSTAIFTRQNNNGQRRGLECPEERDYYPYWGASPWKDIALLTSLPQKCAWVWQSQNVIDKYECNCPTCISNFQPVPMDPGTCKSVGGTWTLYPRFNIPAPYCGQAPTTRENYLGNDVGGGVRSSAFDWTLPYTSGAMQSCVIRIRYNVTSGDLAPDGSTFTQTATSALNGANSPIHDRSINPTSEILSYQAFDEFPVEDYPAYRLGMEVNTNQYGRVFQDRSYVFSILPAPTTGDCAGRMIYNLNIRGKRGNIVQTFPAVEGDFTPSELWITDADCVHVQWTGSDYNPARNDNDAYGGPPSPQDLDNGRSDRHNMVQTYYLSANNPIKSLDWDYNMFQMDRTRKLQLMFIGQPVDDVSACYPIEQILAMSARANTPGDTEFIDQNGNNYMSQSADRDRYYKNCGKLSGARTPYFDGGLFRPTGVAQYQYMDTRSSSFTNRQLIGIMNVQSSFLTNGSYIAATTAGVLCAGLGMAAAVIFRRKSRRQQNVDGVLPGSSRASGNRWAFLPFGRRSSPTGAELAAAAVSGPMAPRRAKPGMVLAASGTSSAGSNVVTALYNHQASEPGELDFRKGDKIIVTRRDDSGWWEGKLQTTGAKGIFPCAFACRFRARGTDALACVRARLGKCSKVRVSRIVPLKQRD